MYMSVKVSYWQTFVLFLKPARGGRNIHHGAQQQGTQSPDRPVYLLRLAAQAWLEWTGVEGRGRFQVVASQFTNSFVHANHYKSS